jgi:1,4-dihydroxy-2-naphthoate octaprenyltransferase
MGVLNINNIRDIESDRLAGKFSLPVRIGRDKAVIYHWTLILGGLLTTIVFTIINFKSPIQWLFVVTLPLFILNGISVSRKKAEELDPFLRQLALSTLLFVLLFGIGIL